jgi:hypothetical protein
MKDPNNLGVFDGEYFERRKRPVGRLLFWLQSLFVQDVPHSMAHCEFGCRTLECSQEKWASCQNRLEAAKR